MSDLHADPSRRLFLGWAAGTAAAVSLGAVLPRAARAADLPHLNPADPAAQALGYVENTAQVSQARYPGHKSTQNCSNCSFFQEVAGSAWGPCQLFPGKSVAAQGWCSAYAPKAA